MSSKYDKLENEKQQEIIQYERKFRLAELKSIENTSNQKENLLHISEMTKNYIQEIKDLMQGKLTMIEKKMIDKEKSETEFRSKLIENLDCKINLMVKNFKESYEQAILEEKKIYNNQLENMTDKNISYSKNLEWYKKQISELHPYKQKAKMNQEKIEQLTEENKNIRDMNNVLKEKNNTIEIFLNNLGEQNMKNKASRDMYKNAFSDAEKVFNKYVPGKKLRDLLNLRDFVDV